MNLSLSQRQTLALSRLLLHLRATLPDAGEMESPPFSAADLRHLLPLLQQIKKAGPLPKERTGYC